MGWMEGDLARRVLGVLILLLVIYESKGSIAQPPVISPSKPEIVSQIVQKTVPSVQPNASSDQVKNVNISPIGASPSPDSQQQDLPHRKDSSNSHEPSPEIVPTGSSSHLPSSLPPNFKAVAPSIHEAAPSIPRKITREHQAPDISHATSHKLSSAHSNPPVTQIRDGGDINAKNPNGSLFTLQHAPAPSPRLLPFNSQNVQLNSRGSHPPIASPSSAKGLNGFPVQNSEKRENYAPHPNNGKHYTSSPYDINHEISPPFNPSIEISKNKRRYFAPPPNFDGFEINPSASHAPIMTSKHKRRYAPSHPPVEISNNKIRNYAPPPYVEGPQISPASLHPPMETSNWNTRHRAASPYPQGHHLAQVQAPTSSNGKASAAPLPASTNSPSYIIWKIYSPDSSPSSTSGGKSSPQSKHALPPPPPSLDCGHMMCESPLANPCPRSLCICVLPIKVGLRLGVALYVFFPLVSEFAKEIATGVSMKQSQVRIMGANSATEDSEKTDVLIDLVPVGKSFDNTTVFITFEKFWKKQVSIQASYFGDYAVLYVNYQGLPPSPPTASYLNGEAYANKSNGRTIHPLGVDVTNKQKKLGVSGSVIAIIAMTSLIALVLIIGAAWLLLLKNRELSDLLKPNFQSLQPSFAKPSATEIVPENAGIGPNSTSASLSSSIAKYKGSAKTFTLAEMERSTNRFDDLRVLGEGGFGRVYQGTLEDGTMVAVKVLKRDDRQGEREFLAEVEMLSRLHHRNLVKLIGICIEENVRCLVYELIPNGSVESHLHGIHKETAPLDWNSRVKIALGAARALTYLHEDSSPCVIHRDFKSSNILLEHDFTPRVSDFGLARSAMEEGKEHISTRVMGTFGYVDPEYAMTGHLLVKSDVYSYGVVLLELLTGRKPIDLSQPPGQENLVAWTRSLLANIDGLETIIDPALNTNCPHNSVAKVAAIASMCVQPEVSHRPLMSEIVQALRLVSNDSDEYRDEVSVRDVETGKSMELCGGTASDVFCASSSFTGDASFSFRRGSSSGPLRAARSSFSWQRKRGLGSGSLSEHGIGMWWRRH